MDELTVFKNETIGCEVRGLVKNGEPWFVAKDVCDFLEIKNSRDAIAKLLRRLKSAEISTKGVDEIYTLYANEGEIPTTHVDYIYMSRDSEGKNPRKMTIVSEAMLNELMFSSTKPLAIKYRYWVTSKVLPTIRKTGIFSVKEQHVPGYGLLNQKLHQLEKHLKKELPGYNGRIKAGRNLASVALQLRQLLYDFFMSADTLVLRYEGLRKHIGGRLAQENPSLEEIRYWYNHVTTFQVPKQISA